MAWGSAGPLCLVPPPVARSLTCTCVDTELSPSSVHIYGQPPFGRPLRKRPAQALAVGLRDVWVRTSGVPGS